MPYKDNHSPEARESRRKASARYALRHPERAKKQRMNWKAQQAKKMRQVVIEAKIVPCMDCGERYPHYVMDFDHRDPETKVMSIANMVGQQVGVNALLAELEKCDVVCSNCHRVRTHNQYKDREGKPWYDRWDSEQGEP